MGGPFSFTSSRLHRVPCLALWLCASHTDASVCASASVSAGAGAAAHESARLPAAITLCLAGLSIMNCWRMLALQASMVTS